MSPSIEMSVELMKLIVLARSNVWLTVVVVDLETNPSARMAQIKPGQTYDDEVSKLKVSS